jgi:hypothetical protein
LTWWVLGSGCGESIGRPYAHVIGAFAFLMEYYNKYLFFRYLLIRYRSICTSSVFHQMHSSGCFSPCIVTPHGEPDVAGHMTSMLRIYIRHGHPLQAGRAGFFGDVTPRSRTLLSHGPSLLSRAVGRSNRYVLKRTRPEAS